MNVDLGFVLTLVAFFYLLITFMVFTRILPVLRFSSSEVLMGFYHLLTVSLLVSLFKIAYSVVPSPVFKRLFAVMSFGLSAPFAISATDFVFAVYQLEDYFKGIRTFLRWFATFTFAMSIPFFAVDAYLYLCVVESILIGTAGIVMFLYVLCKEGFGNILRKNVFVSVLTIFLFFMGMTEGLLIIFRKVHLPLFSQAQFLFVLALNEAVFSRLKQIQDQVETSSKELSSSIALKERQIMETLEEAVSVLEMRDAITGGQSRRVSSIAVSIAEVMGLTREEKEIVRMGAMLHDIGKIAIPDRILLKPSSLTPEEKKRMQSHVFWGWKLLHHLTFLEKVLPVVYYHHERYDGTGYLEGVSSKNLPLMVRIVTVADAFDAMIYDRPYRKGVPVEEALQELKANAGTQFDPQVVEVLERLVRTGKIDFVG